MWNNHNQNPEQSMNGLPDAPPSYVIFVDGNMAGKELKCTCGKIYAWLDRSNIMTSECRNDPVISAFLKKNYRYDTRKDSYDSYGSHSNNNYHSPPRVSDREYYRYNNERSRRSPSPYQRSQSRHSGRRRRRHSRSYSDSRSSSRSSSRRRSRRYNDDNFSRSRYPNQPPVIQYGDIKQEQQIPSIQPAPQQPLLQQQQQQQQPSRQPIIQLPSVQHFPPSSLPVNRQQQQPQQLQQPAPPPSSSSQQQQQQPLLQPPTIANPISSSPPPLLNNNKNNSNNVRPEDSWASTNSRDNVWGRCDDNDNQNNNNNNNQSPISDSDNSSVNSNYVTNVKTENNENQQYSEDTPQQQQLTQSGWDIPKPINELCYKYPGKTMDEVGRDQLIADVQEYNNHKGFDSDYESVAHTVDYQMVKNRILLRIEYIVKSVDKCPLSRISSLYEEKYGEKLDLQKDLGFKKLSKCLDTYGFKQQPMVNLTIVTPSNRIWF